MFCDCIATFFVAPKPETGRCTVAIFFGKSRYNADFCILPALLMTRSGTLFILGGAIRPDHAAIWQEIIRAAGGAGCRFAVIAAASAQAALKAGRICERLQHYGAQTLTVPLSDEGQLPFSPAIAEDTSWADAVSACDGIYLSGGDQGRLHRLLFRSDGRDSAVLTVIRTVYARGGVIAGSSAGAAILSQHMLLDAGLSLPALQRGLAMPTAICNGFGFVPAGMLIDQHAIARGRYGRMLAAQLATSTAFSAGVDEDTALILHEHNARVCGSGGVVLLDIRNAHCVSSPPLQASQVSMSLLRDGDSLDLRAWQIRANSNASFVSLPASIATEITPHNITDAFDGASLEAIIAALIDSDACACKVLAQNDDGPDYLLQFRKTIASRAWVQEQHGVRRLSVAGLQLSAEPDTMRSINDSKSD